MFRTKSEVDQHVAFSLPKLKPKEKNLRSMNVAKLYLRVQDYESARNYIMMYLSEKEDSALAHKILGDALQGLGQKTKAIAAYKKSLELEATQPELLTQICQLLCDKDVEFDASMARYCLNRAHSSGFSHHPVVFTLQEKLLTADSSTSQEDYEKLIMSELKARPSDVSVRVKLLELLLNSKKIEIAYSHVLDVEAKQLHPNNPDWYRCSTQVFKVYFEQFPKKCDWEFYVSWLCAIDRLCVSSMSETSTDPIDIVTVAESIHTLDQTIHLTTQKVAKAPELYTEYIKHVTGQLAFHLVVLLMKRSKKETSTWRETKKFIGPLLLFAASDPPNTEGSWCLTIKGNHRDMLNSWAHQGHCRYFQAGQLLNVLVKECQTEKMFLDKVNYFAANDWRKRVFEKIFLEIDEASSTSSHFVTSHYYVEIPRKLPYISSITPSLFVQSFERHYPNSLHHLVWLGLHSLQSPRSVIRAQISPSLHTMLFKNMQFTIANLNNTGVETLNRLDVDAFLYATILSTGAVLEGQQESGYFPPDRPSLLPADITSPLCTADQQKWWSSACSISKGGGRSLGNVKMSDLRQNLQRGIEVIRGDGLPLPLQICLARTFSVRASESESIDESGACENRAVNLWKIALPSLERLNSNQSSTKFNSKSTLFEHPIKDIPPGELPQLLDEGRLFLANSYLAKGQLEKALELFNVLRSPQAHFQTASIYLDLAREQANGLRNSQETKTKCAALTAKARKALQATKEMLRGDPNNSLQFKIKQKYGELDDFASRADDENGVDLDGVGSDGHYSVDSGGEGNDSPITDRLATPLTSSRVSRSTKPTASSTPRRSEMAKFGQPSGMADILGLQQNSNQLKLQQIMELSKLTLDRMDSIIIEQRTQRQELTTKFNNLETEVKNTLADIRKEVKRLDLYNMLDDEDYQTEDMFQYQSNPVAPSATQQATASRTVTAPGSTFFNQRAPQASEAAVAQLAAAGAIPQYFSPRVDQMYQNSVNFFNTQGTLPFVDGQSVPDYLRGLNHLNHQPKFSTQLPGALPAVMPPPFGHPLVLNPQLQVQASIAAGAPRILPQPTFAPSTMLPGGHGPGAADMSRGPTNVVITTSDPLPTGTPPAQPTLSVTIPPQHLHQSSDLSSSHQFQINLPGVQKLPNTQQQVLRAPEIVGSDDDGTEAGIATAVTPQSGSKTPQTARICFIPGEENSEVLFEKKTRLSKTANNTWEDVGNGTIKVFKTKTDKKSWVVMRREKTLDICAQFQVNHDLKPDFKVSDTTCIWEAFDSSKLPGRSYKFSAKFKTREESTQFKTAFESAIASSRTPSTPNQSFTNTSQLSFTNNSSTATPNKSPSFTLAPGKLFSNTPQNSPLNSSLFSTPQLATPMGTPVSFPSSGATPTTSATKTGLAGVASHTVAVSSAPDMVPVSTSQKTILGGFTFSGAPKLNVPLELKPEQKPAETKKTESPFANLNFNTASENKSFSFLNNEQTMGLNKPQSVDLTGTANQNKPLFGSTVSFSDFGSLAKSANQTLTSSSAKTSSSLFANAGTPVFGNLSTPGGGGASSTPSGPVSSPQENDEDFVPKDDFKPVIPLPELVKVVSGEEGEEVLFAERGKLYRFDKAIAEWRDRGVGIMKILRNNETGVVRLLMRRDQVYKVCCSHRLTKELVVTKSKTNEKCYCWVANDFSDDTNGTIQHLQIRFGTPEQGINFEETFKKAQENLVVSPSKAESKAQKTEETPKSDKPPLSTLVVKKAGSWDCSMCMVQNVESTSKCVACGTMKPGSEPLPKKEEKPKFSFGIPSENADSATGPTDAKSTVGSLTTKTTFKSPWNTQAAPTFSFGVTPTALGQTDAKVSAESSAKVDQVSKAAEAKTTSSQIPLSATFSQPEGSWECKSCYSRNPGTASSCASCQTARPGAIVISASKLGPIAPASFSFGTQGTGALTNEVSISKPDSKFSFGLGLKSGGIGDSKDGVSTESKPSVFSFGAAGDSFGKSCFQFSMSIADPKSPEKNESVSDHDVSELEEHEDNIHFQPVIPLPDIVEAKTGEEEELVLYSHRAKVFRFDGEAKEWKERGTGDVKILQHSSTGKKRLLMRREPVMKLCLNHYITEGIEMKSQDDKSWLWVATDFALGEPSLEKFAIRFKNKEIATGFYEAFEKAKKSSDTPLQAIQAVTSSSSAGSKLDSDDDVVYVKSVTASKELQEKARSLQLPDNFYLYLDKPSCPGCPGCDDDDDDEAAPIDAANSTVSSVYQPTVPFWSTPTSQPKAEPAKPQEASTVKPKEVASAEQATSVFGGSQPLFGSPATTFSFSNVTYSFSQKAAPTTTTPPSQSLSQPMFQQQSFSSPAKSEPSIFAGTGGSLFSKDTPTFGALAANANPTAPPSFLTPGKQNFTWEGAGTSLFGHLASSTASASKESPATAKSPQTEAKTGADNADDDPEREVAVHFEPVVPLPDIIELSTGEEDEEALFNERCKLYIFTVNTHDNTKVWKERGTGNMKVLKHKTNNTYRLLMRREQVHKVVVNQRITAELDLQPMPNSETSVMWAAMNLAQEYTEPQVDTLALKCKNREFLEKFKSIVNDAITTLKSQ